MTSEPLSFFNLWLLRFFLLLFLLWFINISSPFSFFLRVSDGRRHKDCFFRLLFFRLFFLFNDWRNNWIVSKRNFFLFLRLDFLFLFNNNILFWTNSPFSTCLLLFLTLKLSLLLYSFKSFKDIVWFTNIKRNTWFRLFLNNWRSWSSKSPFAVFILLSLQGFALLFSYFHLLLFFFLN